MKKKCAICQTERTLPNRDAFIDEGWQIVEDGYTKVAHYFCPEESPKNVVNFIYKQGIGLKADRETKRKLRENAIESEKQRQFSSGKTSGRITAVRDKLRVGWINCSKCGDPQPEHKLEAQKGGELLCKKCVDEKEAKKLIIKKEKKEARAKKLAEKREQERIKKEEEKCQKSGIRDLRHWT